MNGGGWREAERLNSRRHEDERKVRGGGGGAGLTN